MGEYAKRITDGVVVKIDTCENMYYLRYEDRDMVSKENHSLNPANTLDLFWRLPFPDEDKIKVGEYENHSRGELLYNQEKGSYQWPKSVEFPGIIQLKHPSGLLVNVACYHGEQLPERAKDFKPFWNGKGNFWELTSVKNTKTGIVPVISCHHCKKMWSCEWDEVLPYIQDEQLSKRLKLYQQVGC